MKSPNNTTDIPDVRYRCIVDDGLRDSEEKRGEVAVRKEKLRT